jgi:hypothetical protein
MSGTDSAPSPPSLISVEGRIREISFQSEESGYTVLHCKDLASQKVIVMVGDMPLVKEGERLTFQGKWVNHPRFGKQFRVQSYESIMPTSAEGIESFFGFGPTQRGGACDRQASGRTFWRSHFADSRSSPRTPGGSPRPGRAQSGSDSCQLAGTARSATPAAIFKPLRSLPTTGPPAVQRIRHPSRSNLAKPAL